MTAVVGDPDEGVAGIRDRSIVLIGGFVTSARSWRPPQA